MFSNEKRISKSIMTYVTEISNEASTQLKGRSSASGCHGNPAFFPPATATGHEGQVFPDGLLSHSKLMLCEPLRRQALLQFWGFINNYCIHIFKIPLCVRHFSCKNLTGEYAQFGSNSNPSRRTVRRSESGERTDINCVHLQTSISK